MIEVPQKSIPFFLPQVFNGHDWKGLELAVFRMLGHVGWTNLQYIGKSGDKGADLLGVKYDSKLQRHVSYLFQVKAVTGKNLAPTSAIDEALSAQSFYEADRVVVVSNGRFAEVALKRRDALNAANYSVQLWDGATLKAVAEKCADQSRAYKHPWPYQESIVNSVVNAYEAGKSHAFFVVATGLGKTLIAAELTRRLYHEKKLHRVLVLCHSIELAVQLQKSFWSQIGKGIATRLFFGGERPVPIEGINFGLYQSLYTNLGGFSGDEFDLIVVDEAHHALANAFSFCITHLKPKLLVGMTATPWRGDGQSVEQVFGSPLASVSLIDGMRMGRLAEVDYRIMCDNIKWNEIPKLAKKKLSIRDLNKRLFVPQRDEAVIAEIKKVIAGVQRPKIAVFSPTIEHARRFALALNSAGIKTGMVSSKQKVYAHKTLLQFSGEELQAITSVDMLNEGIDVPDINVIVFLRATHSRRIFVQQLGRGLRTGGGKKKVVVLDFVTDIRRISAVKELNAEAKSPPKSGEVEVVYLRDGVVSFSDAKVKSFIDAWLGDVADIQDCNESAQLSFPDLEEVVK